MKQTVEEAAHSYAESRSSGSTFPAYYQGFIAGDRWHSEQSPWIDINDRSVIMPNDKMCLLRLEDGSIVRDTEEWEDRCLLVTHWMQIPALPEGGEE